MSLGADARALLDAPFPCSLTTIGRDGQPHAVVLWCGRDGDDVLVNGGEGAAWMRRLRRDPRVALTVVDTGNIYRYLTARGVVTEIREDAGYAQMDAMARVYDGTEDYVWEHPDDATRFVVRIDVLAHQVGDLQRPQVSSRAAAAR
jgi:PPOX class probable F420-dependent enzyme